MLATLLEVALLHWAVMVTPGANVLVVSGLAAGSSRVAACFAALGVTTAAAIWSALAVLGVNTLFGAHPFLRQGLQLAGGTYLLYVATRLWKRGTPDEQDLTMALTPRASFRLGFLTNITNPKSALFFGSVFASALPASPSKALLAAAVALVLVDVLCWHTFLALTFSQRHVRAAYARQRKVLGRVVSTCVALLGLRLIAASIDEARRL